MRGTAATIAGIGQSLYTRGTEYTELELALMAARAACEDAAIHPTAVDGLIIPGRRMYRAEDVIAGLQIADLVFSATVDLGGASSVAALGHAVAAITSGRAERILILGGWRGFTDRRLRRDEEDLTAVMSRVFPNSQLRTELEHPYGLIAPIQYYAFHANRWMFEYGIDSEALAAVALAARQYAHSNPYAVMQGRPMTQRDYETSPMVSPPLRVLDCCLETDGAAAVMVCPSGLAPYAGVSIRAVAEGRPDSPDDLGSRPDILDIGLSRAASRAYADSGLGPGDFDLLELYDCFTFIVLRQLEELGFCARGDSPSFVLSQGIGPGGGLPVNTHGGLLSEAHVLGMNHIVEAVRQLRGDSGPRQVENARTALVTGYGDFGDGSIAILTKVRKVLGVSTLPKRWRPRELSLKAGSD